MVIHLTDRVAVFVKTPGTFAVGLQDTACRFRVLGFKPVEKRGPEIKAETGVIIVDTGDHSLRVKQTGKPVGPVALVVHAFVPIVIGRGRRLAFYNVKPWVFTGRLVKMPVNDHEAARSAGMLIANHRPSRSGSSRFSLPTAA